MNNLIAIVVSYVVGSFISGYYLVKFRTGKDVRTLKSGSAGARNVGRELGASGFIVTFVCDTLKGVIALYFASVLKAGSWALMIAVLAVVIGHIYPFQLNFKGGKGLSPALGAVLVFDYRIAVSFFVVAFIIFILTRNFEICSFVGLATLPLITYFLTHNLILVLGMLLLAALILFAHRENIRIILKSGKEHAL